jgi:3',5'-cyclic AMP phosphodiesterase CpdA
MPDPRQSRGKERPSPKSVDPTGPAVVICLGCSFPAHSFGSAGLTLLFHISDLHFGPPIRWDRVHAIQAAIEELRPDLVVASGDFVQRADFPSQFLAAQGFLRGLSRPVLPVPGNHELPLLNPVRRLLRPYTAYQRYIHPELEPEHRANDVLVLAVNSTKPYLIHGGFTTARQIAEVDRRIGKHSGVSTAIVATHHPLVGLPERNSWRPQARAARTLGGFSEAGVDLVLSGHFHSFRVVRASEQFRNLRREVYVVLSGSTTSRRVGRKAQRGNGFATIAVEPRRFRVTHYLYGDGRGFEADDEVDLPRT